MALVSSGSNSGGEPGLDGQGNEGLMMVSGTVYKATPHSSIHSIDFESISVLYGGASKLHGEASGVDPGVFRGSIAPPPLITVIIT